MKRAASPILPIPVDRDLKSMIEAAAKKTRLCQADVMRSALRTGLPEVVRRHGIRHSPRRSLAEYLDTFAGLVKPNRELVSPSRFK
ncbi:MAG: hypothetical protein ACREFE_08865 [Limisphaerales bacterium]